MSEMPQLNLDFDEFCLFVDVDGTLVDLAPRPEYVHATEDILATLDSLYFALGGALAVVSGRRIEDIDRIFSPLRLPASGIHGAQIRRSPDSPIFEGPVPDIPAAVASAAADVAARHPGAFIENKGKALAVHWRAIPDQDRELWAGLTAAVERVDPSLTLMRGHCVFEIKSPTTTKGDAVRTFMKAEPFANRTPVFIGDDITDIAGMAAVKTMGGCAYSVGQRLEGADAVFASPAAVRSWLGGLVGALEAGRA